MAVKDVFKPKATNLSDPQKPKEEKVGYWEKKAKEAQAEREYLEEQERMKRIGQPLEAPEPPFKMSGEFNLGKIDIQEQQRQAKEDADKMREEKDKALKDEQQKRVDAEEKAHQFEIQGVQQALTQKIDNLEKMVQQGMTQKNFAQQAAEIRELATELGFQRPDPALASAGDATIRLEISRLNMEEKRLEREFKWKMRQDDKQWQLEMQKLQDDRGAKQAELAQQAKRDDMFASFPQRIGSAIGKGMVESGEGGGVSERPKGKSHHIEAGTGDSGEVECPSCGQPIGIGPTARSAVCANCGTRLIVKRTETEAPAEEE